MVDEAADVDVVLELEVDEPCEACVVVVDDACGLGELEQAAKVTARPASGTMTKARMRLVGFIGGS